jgi:hypothetical protein
LSVNENEITRPDCFNDVVQVHSDLEEKYFDSVSQLHLDDLMMVVIVEPLKRCACRENLHGYDRIKWSEEKL